MPQSACMRAFHAACVSDQGGEGGGRGGGRLVKAKADGRKWVEVRVKEEAMAAVTTVVSKQGRVRRVKRNTAAAAAAATAEPSWTPKFGHRTRPSSLATAWCARGQHRLAAHERHSRCPEQLERAVSALSDDPRGRWAGVLSEPANYNLVPKKMFNERRDLVLCTAEGHETGCLIVSTKLMQVLKTCPTSPGAPQVRFGDQAITPLIEGDSGHAAQGGALGKLKFRPFGESRAT